MQKNINYDINKCLEIITSRDMQAAKFLRYELTEKYYNLIPNRDAGLMACITRFYIDDIEVMLAKIIDYQNDINLKG